MSTASFKPPLLHQEVSVRRGLKCMYPVTSITTKIVFVDSSPVEMCNAECSCVAGTALCNHTVALLYQTAHYSQLNLTAVPPVLSCTETEQRWHKPRTMGVKPGRVGDMVVVSTKPKQRTVADGVRSTLYKAVQGDLPDQDVLKVSEIYKDFSTDIAPLITTLSINADIALVDSALGKVQEGSPISFHHPVPVSRTVIYHPDCPPPALLPLDGYRLEPTSCQFVCSHQQQLHLQSLETTLDMARRIEAATRKQSDSVEWYRVRKPRITSSRFREVCHVRGQSSSEHLAERIRRGTAQTAAMKRGLALEPVAIQEYCRTKNTNFWPCGFVIHPDVPWLGSSPDGVIFDPTERPPFGLLEIKCPNAKSYVDCSYLKLHSGTMQLKSQHSYYWQVQGQLLITGIVWCDFVVFAEDDMLIQRIYQDNEVARIIREKGDYFFFYFYICISQHVLAAGQWIGSVVHPAWTSGNSLTDKQVGKPCKERDHLPKSPCQP
ncbi:uncharacterized protein LOC113114890 [Carassius auratus]|uniref:Uncharacterized protein LOC113114890 n=1 Tax=Carassius auratus TaxID=7957 RepID=A0A6P6QZ76_CARAU|nr:uncharacterized protein LOC113114890 [Carassius auratus]